MDLGLSLRDTCINLDQWWDAKAKKKKHNFFFLTTNLFTTCELFEGEENYFKAFCTKYGAI